MCFVNCHRKNSIETNSNRPSFFASSYPATIAKSARETKRDMRSLGRVRRKESDLDAVQHHEPDPHSPSQPARFPPDQSTRTCSQHPVQKVLAAIAGLSSLAAATSARSRSKIATPIAIAIAHDMFPNLHSSSTSTFGTFPRSRASCSPCSTGSIASLYPRSQRAVLVATTGR